MIYTIDTAVRLLRALDYPYWCPQGSYVFFKGQVLNFEEVNTLDLPASTIRSDRGKIRNLLDITRDWGLSDAEIISPRHVVVAHGSNASPTQLAFKFSESEGASSFIPVIKATLQNYDVVYAAQFSLYGAVPATLTPRLAAESKIHINLLTDAQLEALNISEGLGDRYELVRLPFGKVSLDGGLVENEPRAYIATSGGLLIENTHWAISRFHKDLTKIIPIATQREILERVCTIFNHENGVEEFIISQLNDDNQRLARNIQLKSEYCLPFKEALIEVFNAEWRRRASQ